MRAFRKAASVAAVVAVMGFGFAGTASATSGLYTGTLQSFQSSSLLAPKIQCWLSLSNLFAIGSTSSFSSYTSFSFFTAYSFGATSSWLNTFSTRYCSPVPEPTAALAFATGLLVLSRGMRRRS